MAPVIKFFKGLLASDLFSSFPATRQYLLTPLSKAQNLIITVAIIHLLFSKQCSMSLKQSNLTKRKSKSNHLLEVLTASTVVIDTEIQKTTAPESQPSPSSSP